MRIFDAHCDLLYKLWKDPEKSEWNDLNLHVTIEKLFRFGAKIQCFAIFVPVEAVNKKNARLHRLPFFTSAFLNAMKKSG